MLLFPHTSTPLPARRGELPKRKEDPRLQLPACRNKLKGITRVAVVGGGLAGLMAARRLVQFGVKVTVYEARKEVGGRVLSNRTFSDGRITEEGAELIGSFHTKWLELAHEFGLSMISRMDPDLYERAGLDVQLILQKRLSRGEFKKLTNEMYTRVLTPLSLMAAREINHQDQPWLQSELQKYDNMSVQEALPKFCQISERNKNPADEPLWQMLEFKLVNDEVARLNEMNFLGLLCKIRGGQGERMNPDLPRLTDGYWDELEIFRCAEGCQTLATKLAAKIETNKYGPEPATVRRLVAVTHINISTTGVTLGVKATRPDGKFVDDKPPLIIPGFSYVILAIPPSVWSRVKITAGGQDADPAKWTGGMQMNGAVKHFSDVKERFWIQKKAAPYGGTLRMGQVWEGTDNQTRVGKQGIVLSVFAGPVSASGRTPTREEIRNGLSTLYPDYLANLTKPPLFSDWPNVPFIKTGYWTPAVREIFRVGEKLSKAFHDRLFFAGEHTQMDFFGYMEGALRSGERAAETLAMTACDLLKDPGPKAPNPQILTRATPTRETTAFEREVGKRLEERSPIVDPEEAGSPFIHQELFVMKPEEKLERRAAALVSESPFVGAIEEHTSSFDYDQLKDQGALDELEAETDFEAKEFWVEQESSFEEPETEGDIERLIEAQLGLTGEDDRKEVPDTTIQPYRWICSVTYEKDGQTLDGGTGLLISNRHVLTAAHVITDARLGQPNAPSLVVYPGRHYRGDLGRYLSAKTRVPNSRLDFGLITLDRPVDPSLLWWGHPSTNTDWWNEAAIPFRDLRQRAFPITTAGFPGAKDSYRRKMYEAQGVTVPATFGINFRHTADTTKGQSGSPLWTEIGGRRILIGIVSAFDRLPNQIGVFVHDAAVQRQVRRWMAEDAPKPRTVERRIALEIPYRWVCRLEVYDNDLRRNVGYGAGLLISNRHVLTSARVIYEYSRNRRRYEVRVTPGYEFGKEAFGSTTASHARVSPMFSPATKDGSADYGLLTLSRPLGSAVFSSIGNSALGFWGGESHGLTTTAADFVGKAAHIAAFSRLSGGGAGYHKLRVSTGAIAGLQRGQVLHRASSKLDAPGAPIWTEAGKRRLLVGIASSVFSKDSELNLGCYLSQETQNQLMQWINMDYEQTEIEVRDLGQDELELVVALPGAEAEDYDQLKGPGALDELEAETDWETKEVWDELKEGQLAPQADQTEDESLDYEDALLREDETQFEKPEGFAAGESQLEWFHEDLSDDLSLEKEPEWERSEIEGENFSDVSFEEEGSSKRIPISRSKASFSQVSMASSVVDPFPRPIIMPLDMAVSLSRDNSKIEFGKCIEDASRPADVSGLCGAVIDLTGDPDLPPYVGRNDTDMLYVGSLAKIYPLLAAFELRRRVTRQAKDMIRIGLSTATAGWQNKVFAELKKGWQPKLDAAFKNPKLPSGFPDLAKVVEISPDGVAKLRQEFLGWIRAALGQNDETAVGKYIRALSYPYINGVLAAAGFFKPADKKGLWISGDYNGNDWKTADGAGMPLTARWQSPGHPVSNFTGTALQVVRFLGLMAQGKLVDPDSSREMIDLLGVPFLHKTLTDATPSPRPFTSALGKVGIGTWDGRYHDSAIVRIERGGDPARRIRYALAVLGSPNGTARLRKLELAYHDCVVARHP